jgi:hypothetical protein
MSHLHLSNLTDLAFFGGRALILVLAFMTFAWAFGRWRRAAARDTQRLFEQLDVTLYELRGVSERVHGLESRLNTLQHRIEQDGQRPPVAVTSVAKGYDVAVRLAKNGLGVDELISNCGVARHEAELLVRLHGMTRAEPPKRGTASIHELPAPQAPTKNAQLTWPVAPTQNHNAPQAPTTKPALRRRGSLVSVVG